MVLNLLDTARPTSVLTFRLFGYSIAYNSQLTCDNILNWPVECFRTEIHTLK